MILRAIEEKDIEVLTEAEKRCFKDPWTKEMFSALLKLPFQYGFIAEEGGQVCGYCCLSVLFEEAEVLNIAVDTPFRKRGVGAEILQNALEKAKELGAEKCFLEVRVSNLPALTLYRKFGFENLSIRAKYYEDGEDALVMVKKL
jgi:ribosomal-protein-alanine N-acetyltransferase